MPKFELSTRVGLLAISVATLAAPVVAQNGASSTWPVNTFVAVATGDDLITLSAPGFEGCQYDDEAYPFYGPEAEYFGPVPGMTFWSVQGVPSAPATNLHLIITPKGAVNVGVDGCGGAVLLSMVRHWVVKSDTDISVTKLTASRGPTLSCR